MPHPPTKQGKRDFPGRRWLGIGLRSLHLVGVVMLGLALQAQREQATAGSLVLATGLAIFGMDLWSSPKHFGDFASVFIMLKLLLVGSMLAFPAAAIPLFWGLVVASSLISHAPAQFRHIRIFN